MSETTLSQEIFDGCSTLVGSDWFIYRGPRISKNKLLFSFWVRGRIWRLENIIIPAIPIVILIVLEVISRLVWATGIWEISSAIISLLVLGTFPWLCITSAIKRLHDLDRSGGELFGLLIPIVNIRILFNMLFVKWTLGVNQFWPDPLQKEAPAETNNQ